MQKRGFTPKMCQQPKGRENGRGKSPHDMGQKGQKIRGKLPWPLMATKGVLPRTKQNIDFLQGGKNKING